MELVSNLVKLLLMYLEYFLKKKFIPRLLGFVAYVLANFQPNLPLEIGTLAIVDESS